MQYSAAVARESGVDFDHLAAYIATISSVMRISAESVGQSLKTMLTRMEQIKIGKLFEDDATTINDVAKALDAVGIALMEDADTFRPMQDVLKDVAAGWDTFTEKQQRAIAGTIAGVRQVPQFSVLMQHYGEVNEALAIQTESAGLATQRFGIYLESVEAKINKFTAAWEKLMVDTINSDLIKSILDIGTAVLKVVDDIGVMNLAIIAAFAVAAVQIPAITNAFQLFGNAVLYVATSMGMATVAAAELSLAMTGGLIGLGIVAAYFAFDKLNNTIIDVYNNFEKAKSTFDNNKTELSSLADEYEKLATKTNKTAEETNRLLEIQTIANDKYNALSNGVNLFSDATENNTGKIQKNVKWLREQVVAQQDLFLEQQKIAYQQAQGFLESGVRERRSSSGTPGFIGTAIEYRKELQRRIALGDDILGQNSRMLDQLDNEIADAQNLVAEYERIAELRKEATSGRSEWRGRSAGRDRSRTPEFIQAEQMDDAAKAAKELEDKYASLSDMVSGTLSKAFDEFAEKQDDLGVKLATLRAKLEEATSYKPKTPEGIQKQEAELSKLRAEIAETQKAMDDNANAHAMATRRILFDIILQQIAQQNLTGEVANAAYQMAYNLAASWGLIDQRTAEVMGHISSAVSSLATQEVPAAVTAIQQLGAWAESVAGDYTIRFNVITTYSQVHLPQGGDPKTGYPPGYEPQPPDTSGGYYPGGFDPKSSGGGGSTKTKEEKKYSASNLYQMIIDLIREEKQAEIDLLKVKQDSIKLEQKAIEDQKDALDDQLDAYNEIIDTRKELLRTEQEEISYQEEIADRNKSIAKLQNELAVLALDNSAESKAKQLEIQEDLDKELDDLAKTQRDHSYGEQEKALDKEYQLYEENINKQKDILQQQYDLLGEQYDLVQTQIDAIEEFLSKSGLVGQEAIKRISEMTPELYKDLIAWNQEYGSGIEEDVVRAWEEAEKAIKKYKDVVDAIRGESEFGGGGSGGGGGGNLNWKRAIGLTEGTPLWEEAVKLGKKKFLEKYPQYKKHHTGLDAGPVGDMFTPTNEVFAKLMKGEMVLNNQDMISILGRIPTLAKNLSGVTNNGGNITIEKVINIEGNVDKTCMPRIEEISKLVVKDINKLLTKRGFIRGAQVLGI